MMKNDNIHSSFSVLNNKESGARMVLSFEEKQPSKMPRRLSKASTRSQRKRSFFEIVGPQSSVGEYGSYGAFASHNFAGDPHGMRSRKNPLATMEFAGRRMPSREMYVRSPTTMLAPMPFKDQLRPSRSMQADESKSCAQRAMIKYNLSIDEAGKYQQFIRLLSTFESSTMIPFLQESLKIAKELRHIEYE